MTSALRSSWSTFIELLRKMIECACAGCTFSSLIATAWMKVRHSPVSIISRVHAAEGHMYTCVLITPGMVA